MNTQRIAVNAAISRAIMAKMAEGLPVNKALDAVCGAGTFAKLAGEVYDALRAKSDDQRRARQVAECAIARAKSAASAA